MKAAARVGLRPFFVNSCSAWARGGRRVSTAASCRTAEHPSQFEVRGMMSAARRRPLALAEGGGFEPPVRFPARRFSRPVHSTTLPPLRRVPSRIGMDAGRLRSVRPIRRRLGPARHVPRGVCGRGRRPASRRPKRRTTPRWSQAICLERGGAWLAVSSPR